MRTRVVTFVAPLLLVAAATAGAQGRRGGGPPPDGGPGRGGPGGRCAFTADSLSDGQKAQVKVLSDAFAKAHQAQLDSLRSIMEASREARQAGKSPEEIRAIMELAIPINEALAPARKTFAETVVTYLTPAQLAAGCIPPSPGGPGPGGRGMGGRRGGPPPGPPAF